MAREYVLPDQYVRRGVLVVTICAVSFCATACAGDAASATTQPARRSVPAIAQDVQAARAAVGDLDYETLGVEAQRKAIAPKALPPLKTLATLSDELIAIDDPQARQQGRMLKGQVMSMRVILGDAEATDQLERQSKSTNPSEALWAKSDLMAAHWLLAGTDPNAQEKLAGEASSLAKANPTDDLLTASLISMTNMGAVNKDLARQLDEVILGMKSEAAGQIGPVVEARRKLYSLENKPLVISGVMNGGGEFSTAQWKGKVILVDFWATWCKPCLRALPHVKEAYSAWHEKGLEILGISCDDAGEDLSRFLAANLDMRWPQLFDAKTPGWSPIATGFGISRIPTMFLIDRKGVVRAVDAEENFEELIPKLIEEK